MSRPLSVFRTRSTVAVTLAAAAALALSACSTGSSVLEAPTADGLFDTAGCVTDFKDNVDYFPVKSEVEDAKNFSITYEDSYQVLTVQQPFVGATPESYVLVRCGTPAPELTGDLADAPVIEVPIASVHSTSTTHLPMLVALDQGDIVTGVSNGAWVSDATIYEAVRNGDITEFALDGAVDTERVVADSPDVLLTAGNDDPSYPTLRKAGIPVIAGAEWLEPSVLGRAEWIKLIAALTGNEAQADKVYDDIKGNYREVAAQAQHEEPVEVLAGALWEGSWWMPSGGSYVGEMIRDAGGTYPWVDDPAAGSLQLDFETVFVKSGTAKIWLVNDGTVTSVPELFAQNEQYTNLTAATDGQVWNPNKAIGPGGGDDYWERGVLRPDLILADLVKILHPEVLPDHEFEFYQQLPR